MESSGYYDDFIGDVWQVHWPWFWSCNLPWRMISGCVVCPGFLWNLITDSELMAWCNWVCSESLSATCNTRPCQIGKGDWLTIIVSAYHHLNARKVYVAPLHWAKCEDETHTPKSGSLESSRTPENSEDNLEGQNTLPWAVLYAIGKVLKCRCPKCPRIGDLDIYSLSYGQKKGQESNCQFDSRPLKVWNWPDLDVRLKSAIRRWKDLDEGYNFGLDLVPIGGWGEELWLFKVPGV
jgi:hypothetical protein